TLVHSLVGVAPEMGEHRELGSCQSQGLGLLIESVPPQARDIVDQGADGHGSTIDRHRGGRRVSMRLVLRFVGRGCAARSYRIVRIAHVVLCSLIKKKTNGLLGVL